MANLKIRNVPEDILRALKLWAKEEKSSVSALVMGQLRQQLELRAFERSLRKMPPTDKPLHSKR